MQNAEWRGVEVIPPAGEMSPQATKGGWIAAPYKSSYNVSSIP